MNNKVVAATAMDAKEMLEIIESKATKGNFQLIYTRRPNAYESYLKESDRVYIGLIKDEYGKIAMQTSNIVNDYYINGNISTIGYVGGVRKRDNFGGIFDWKALSDYVASSKCHMYYCSFLSDNKKSISIFTKKHKYFPQLFPVCEYTTYIMNPNIIKGHKKSKYTFKCIDEVDLDKVYEFLNKEGRKYNFSPVVYDLEKQFWNLSLKDCYILEDNGEILAFGALWDQTSYKQYIVTKYEGYMRMAEKLSKVTQMLGYIPIPKENEIIKFPTLTLFFAKDNNRYFYNCFLGEISNIIKKKYKIFVIGIDSNHPNNDVYKKLKSINFKSKIYFVRYDQEVTIDDSKNIHLECGLL